MRHQKLKEKINKEAWKLKEFTARELLYVLNNYPNMHGRKRTIRQVSIQRLTNLLKQNKNVKFIHHPTSLTQTGSWKWIGDKE